MAVALNQTIALVCTSGTAVLNLYPAVCEAYYSQIPLLVITADRPPELIDQWDGQCIRQTNIFEKHCLGSFTFDPRFPNQEINKALGLCSYPIKGPVHINVPLSEPLYEGANEPFEFEDKHGLQEQESWVLNQLPERLDYKKIILLAGADAFGGRLGTALDSIARQNKVVVLADIISGLHSVQNIHNWDVVCLLAEEELKETLKPDLLITIGKFTVSKSFKLFIKKHKPKEHWHITPNHSIADPFQTNPMEYEYEESIFLEWIAKSSTSLDDLYFHDWMRVSLKAMHSTEVLFEGAPLNEFTAVDAVLDIMPKGSLVHSGNSMPVRFLSYLAGKLKGIEVYANRGTSGIDGSVSTAVGTAMMTDQPVFLIVGDLSFFYDINGLWNPYIPAHFKIIVLNNQGGGIFRLIDGPSNLPEREQYFSTHSSRNGQRMAEEFGFTFYQSNDMDSLKVALKTMLEDRSKPGILEIVTEPNKTIDFYKRFKELSVKGELRHGEKDFTILDA